MPRQELSKFYFTYGGGLVTEASPLTFPENSSLDEYNFDLDAAGRRPRRKGVKYQTGTLDHAFPLQTNPASGNKITRCTLWPNPGSDETKSFVVVQDRITLYFYADAQTVGTTALGSITLTSHPGGDGATIHRDEPIDISISKYGILCTGRGVEPALIKYDGSTFTKVDITLQERDFDGIEDGFEVSHRPTAGELNPEHTYNLQNQGWVNNDDDLIGTFFFQSGVYPSNADLVELGYHVDPTTGVKVFAAAADNIDTYTLGSSGAPKGHFIRGVFDNGVIYNGYQSCTPVTASSYSDSLSILGIAVDSSFAAGLNIGDTIIISDSSFTYTNDGSGPTSGDYDGAHIITFITGAIIEVSFNISNFGSGFVSGDLGTLCSSTLNVPDPYETAGRPRCNAFFAGRAWYAGVDDLLLGDRIYFSQIIRSNDASFGKCFQDADPTSGNDPDLVDTDGGVIKIPDMGIAHKMEVVGSALVVFADNGVWRIGEGASGSFSPGGFSVRRLTSIGTLNHSSIVVVEGVPMYWSQFGIYALAEDKISGFLTAQNISSAKIQRFMNSVDTSTFGKYVHGFYDAQLKRVWWLYPDTAAGVKSKALLFDLRSQAWLPFNLTPVGVTTTIGKYVATGYYSAFGRIDENKGAKFLAFDDGTSRWADLTAADWLDFGTTDAAALLETGYEHAGDPRKEKQSKYVSVFMENTDTDVAYGTSACSVRGRWDFYRASATAKFTRSQEAFRTAPGNSISVAKLKIMGSGRALTVRFTTRPAKDCILLGWAASYSAASKD